jgi:hypothetical protein
MPTPLEKGADVRFIGPVMGRYTLESRVRPSGVQIFAVRLQSLSPSLMAASAPVTGHVGEMVTAHFVPFGNIRGPISRHIDGGFVVDIDGDHERRKRLAARIEWYKKRVFSGVTDKREHNRFMPREPRSAVLLVDGRALPCLVIDLSASGAAISVDYRPEIGEPLALGKAVCRVVRRLEVGFAVQFVNQLERDELEEAVRAPEDWERAMRRREAEAAAEVEALADAEFINADLQHAI